MKEECFDNESKSDLGSDAGSDIGLPEQKKCCCSHGMRCTCALKKAYMDLVPEIDVPVVPPRRSASSSKPRLIKAGSDTSMTVFTNGHHKPVHRHNDSAHKCGLPYKIPIPHSVPGSDYARRSTDSLPLIRKKEESHSQLHESISSAQQEVRLVRSEHGSPEPRPRSYTSGGVPPPLDLQYSTYSDSVGQYSEDYAQSPSAFDNYFSAEEQAPVLSAGLSMPPVDWSTLGFDGGAFSAAYSQPPSYANFDHSNVGQSGLTTSSSGDLSEVGDYISHNPKGPSLRPNLTSTSSADNLSFNRLSSSSFTSLPRNSMLSPLSLHNSDYESFLHHAAASPTGFDEPSPMRSEGFLKHGFTVHDAQKLAHPDTPTEAMGGLSLPTPEEDHIWAHRYSPEEGPCVQPTKVENHPWEQ